MAQGGDWAVRDPGSLAFCASSMEADGGEGEKAAGSLRNEVSFCASLFWL